MYSTCLFCHASLGRNEAIEHFPVGRRLAFDAAKGRLWVVCRSCERWNLTPLDERWEAIEECERAFRDTKLRVSTENVGLARLKEGTTLVRIGVPQRPEMAAWRYGDQFGRRRRRYIIVSTTMAAAVGGLIIAGPMTGLIGGGAVNLFNLGNMVRTFAPSARITVRSRQYRLSRRSLQQVQLRPNEQFGYEMEVPYMPPLPKYFTPRAAGFTPSLTLRGDDALQAARVLLPRINASGGGASSVRDAVSLLEATQDASDIFRRLAAGQQLGNAPSWSGRALRRVRHIGHIVPDAIIALPAAQRLALEMALHEEDERRALEGELATLEDRWKEAEEIAAISDDMFLPAAIVERLRRIKGDRAGEG